LIRAQVINPARDLLQPEGPQAITPQAAARRVCVAHGNVTCHFGTLAALQTALMPPSLRTSPPLPRWPSAMGGGDGDLRPRRIDDRD
jgi:hypothetical protein